jgi:hypothetical protein
VLTARTGLSIPDVFTQLRAHARRNRMRLSDLARRIVEGSTALNVPAQAHQET